MLIKVSVQAMAFTSPLPSFMRSLIASSMPFMTVSDTFSLVVRTYIRYNPFPTNYLLIVAIVSSFRYVALTYPTYNDVLYLNETLLDVQNLDVVCSKRRAVLNESSKKRNDFDV